MTIQMRSTHAVTPFLGLLLIAALTTVGASCAQAAELIPSFGVTKSTEANAGNAQGFGGLALRIPLVPLFQLEGGIGYRQDSYVAGAVKVHQWPVTASLWLSPMPALYVGGGLGWYHTTLEYPGALLLPSSTSDKAGVHIGGGTDIPLAPKLSLDLNGRYVFMAKDKATFAVPTTFNPDYWTATLGLAISF